jgi:glycosyltransferase involved in cell wall biosynthesis
MDKKVSIIIPTYNRANLITETLNSIIAQTYNHWECIIIDDGSIDDTAEVVKKYIQNDGRFKVFLRKKNIMKGPSGCRNYGLSKSDGDFILFFDDDDILHPQNLELCVNELCKKDVFFCRYIREIFSDNFNVKYDYALDYSSFEIDTRHIERILKYELFCITGSIMWKRECFNNHLFKQQLTYAEEWELYTRIISSDFKGISINKCLFFGRKHPESITSMFYGDNAQSKQSYNDAILFVVQNLKEKALLSDSILRYFVQLSLAFKEFNLFESILDSINACKSDKIKWRFVYNILPLKLKLYRYWKLYRK